MPLDTTISHNSVPAVFTFTPANAKVRVVEIEGEPWFVAADVCRCLGLYIQPNGNPNVTVSLRPLSSDEKGLEILQTPGGAQRLAVISESGLYKLTLRAHPDRNPRVRAFQDWVTREVLPAIRKDGAYIMGEEKVRTGEMSEDEFVLKAISILQRKIERLSEEKAQLQNHVEEMEPKAALVEEHYETLGRQTLARFGRTLYGLNTNNLKSDLERLGYLWRRGLNPYKVRTQYRDRLFVEHRDNHRNIIDIYVTPKGCEEIVKLYRAGRLTMRKGFRPIDKDALGRRLLPA